MGQGQFQTDEEYATSKGEFKDLKSAKFGTGKDFRIWYTGGNARLVCADGDIQFNHATTYDTAEGGETFANQESMLHLEDDAGVKAYYDGVRRFETLSDGAKVHGKLEVDGDFKLEDDKKLICGDDDDLQIYHDKVDGSPDFSTIKNTTSTQLFIANNNKDIFLRADDGKDGVRLHPSGENYKVELFHNDEVRLTTWSDGIFLDGGLHIKNYDADGWSGSSNHQKLYIGFDKDLQLYHEAVSGGDDFSTIKNTTATQLFIANTNKDIFLRADDGKDGIRLHPSGEDYKVELFHNDTLKFETTSAGAKVTGDLLVTGDIDVDDIRLTDTGVISLGTGADMTIYHDGSDAYIKNLGTGNLFIAGHDDCHIYIRARTGENSIICYDDAGVALYEDNELRFETVDGGCKVTGDLEVTDDIDLSDSGVITFGTGDDMHVYHDGSNGYMQLKGTGNLFISGSHSDDPGDGDTHIYIRAKAGQDSVVCFDDAEVTLHHAGGKKLETQSSGVKITGSLTFANSGQAISLHDGRELHFGSGDDIKMWHDGSNGYLKHTGSGNFFITGDTDDSVDIHIRAKQGDDSIVCKPEAAVELYDDGDKKLATASYGVRILGDLRMDDNEKVRLGNSQDFDIYFNGTDCMFHGTSGYFKFNRNLEPTNHRSYDLGDGSNEWDDVYCVDLDESSDRKWKKDIVTSDLGLSFINKLNPVSYKRTDGTSGRTHYGFVAQEIEQTLTDIGKTTKEFGGVTIDKENYFLRFSQFTAPLTKAVQELSAEVDKLKAEIAALKSS